MSEYSLCHGLSKNRGAQTFNLYCNAVQRKFADAFLGGYILIKSMKIVLKRHTLITKVFYYKSKSSMRMGCVLGSSRGSLWMKYS